MDSASTSAAALKEEIARLTGKSFLVVVRKRRVHISRFALLLSLSFNRIRVFIPYDY